MKLLVGLALCTSALLATASAEAHSHPKMPKGVMLSAPARVATFTSADVDSMASPANGPTFHYSARPAYSGFRSTPSRSYSAPATRSYSAPRTYSFRPSSPSIGTRPATTSAPRTYSISGVPRTKTYTPAPSSSPTEVHHYHNSGAGGMSTTEYILLNQALNNNRQGEGSSWAPPASDGTGRFVSDNSQNYAQGAIQKDDGLSAGAVFLIVLAVVAVAVGLFFGLRQLEKLD